jgi:hypothetical protein
MLEKFACRNLTKTLDYLEVFSRFKDEENIKAVERLLNSHTELEMFERSQLGLSRAFFFALPSRLSFCFCLTVCCACYHTSPC